MFGYLAWSMNNGVRAVACFFILLNCSFQPFSVLMGEKLGRKLQFGDGTAAHYVSHFEFFAK